jgi:Carboxypeptidase regulatory-like domain/TonB dependent receptor
MQQLHKLADCLHYLLLAAVLCNSSILAQSATGRVRGTVLDISGAVIPGAAISLRGNGTTKTLKSNEAGLFAVEGLEAGSYVLTVEAPGFARFEAKLEVDTGKLLRVDIPLKLQVSEQEVTVQSESSQAVSLDASQNASQLVVRGADLDALSDDPDNLAEDLRALAGPSAGPDGGQIYIDGFTGGTLPPKSSIREIRINQNPFSSEYDKLGFGRIEVFTKPGSDKLHGQTFLSDSNAVFNTRNPYSANKPDFNSRQYGGNLGGPLSKRSSYFFDFERRDITDNAVVSAQMLDSNLNPIQFNQSIVTPTERTSFSPRIDFTINDRNTLTARYTWLRITAPNAGIGGFSLPSAAYALAEEQNRIELTETSVLNSRVVNETRFRWLQDHTGQDASSSAPSLVVNGSFFGGGSPLGSTQNRNTQFELQNYTSFTSGSHSMKAGLRVRTSALDTRSEQNFNGEFTFAGLQSAPQLDANNQPVVDAMGKPVLVSVSSLEQYRRTLLFQQLRYPAAEIRALGGGATQLTVAGGNPDANLTLADYGIFFQDEWRPKPNLSVSMGLRYETQNHLHDLTDLAPRLAMAWSPRKQNGKTVLRAGFGIFYDRIGTPLSLNAQLYNGTHTLRYLIQTPDSFPVVPAITQLQAQGVEQNIQVLDERLRAPYIVQGVVGFDRKLPKNSTVSVNFSDSHGVHVLRDVNINAPLPGTYPSPVYPLGSGGPIYDYRSDGVLNQYQLITSLNSRFWRRSSIFATYILGYAKSNTEGYNTFPSNQYDFSQDYGRSSVDVRHKINLGGSYTGKWGLAWSPFMTLRSGVPFDITTGTDPYGQTVFTERPSFASPGQCGTSQYILCTRFGDFNTRPGPGDKLIPRNYGDGPAKYLLSLRLSKTWSFGEKASKPVRPSASEGGFSGPVGGPAGRTDPGLTATVGANEPKNRDRRYGLTFSVQVRNLLNINNPEQRIGALTSPLFGQSNATSTSATPGVVASAAGNRRVDLQLRFSF